MKLICGLPKLSVFARCISNIIIWYSLIVIWALLWAKQPTGWTHIGCLQRRSIRRHRMWTNDGSDQILNSIGDFEWSGVWLRVLKISVTFGGMKASYIHLRCHELEFHFAFDSMKPGWEKEIIITHFPPSFVICSNSYTRILDRSSSLFSSWLYRS